jgi:hypothetical protein
MPEEMQHEIDLLKQKVSTLEGRQERIGANVVQIIGYLCDLHNPDTRFDEQTFRTALREVRSDFENMGMSVRR